MGPTLWITIILYVLLMVALGLWAATRVKGGDDFLVAGRDVAWPLLFCTIGATAVGGGYSVGAVGKTYELGLIMLFASMGGYLQFVFSGLFVAPRFREAEVYTVAGWFEHRFGRGPRVAALVLSLAFSVLVVAAQMAAMGNVAAAILPELADARAVLTGAVVVGGLLVVAYSTAGGLQAVIYTDVVQFVVLFVGFSLTAIFVLPRLAGEWSELSATLPASFLQPTGDKGRIYLFSLFMAFLLGETFGPGYVTRFCAGRSPRDVKLGIAGVGAFLALTFPVVVFLIGLYARLHLPDAQPDQALALVVGALNHPIVAGVIIAALLSAVMSSGDSALNSATAIFVKDIFEHGRSEEQADDRATLRRARWWTAGLGLASIAVAVLWTDVLELLLFTYTVWAPGIVVPVVVGALSRDHSPRVGRAVLTSMVVGPLFTLAYRLTPAAEVVDPVVVGVAVSALCWGGWTLAERLLEDSWNRAP